MLLAAVISSHGLDWGAGRSGGLWRVSPTGVLDALLSATAIAGGMGLSCSTARSPGAFRTVGANCSLGGFSCCVLAAFAFGGGGGGGGGELLLSGSLGISGSSSMRGLPREGRLALAEALLALAEGRLNSVLLKHAC